MAPAAPEPDLDRWIQWFRGPLVGFLASLGADWRQAEELAQDTFAEAWLGRARFQGDPEDVAAVGAWLRGIAFRLQGAALRRSARRRTEPIDAVDPAAPVAPEDERRTVLARAFGRLSSQHQAVLRMFYLEETSTREVAALLGLTPKAVESRLYQARLALRAQVGRIAQQGVPGAPR